MQNGFIITACVVLIMLAKRLGRENNDAGHNQGCYDRLVNSTDRSD